MADQAPPEHQGRIMHVRLDVGDQMLMGSDGIPGHFSKPQGFAVSLQVTASQAERIFEALSQGAEVDMPLQQTFWSPRFGMLRDRFGTPWMINGE